jgi:hypothetical protein
MGLGSAEAYQALLDRLASALALHFGLPERAPTTPPAPDDSSWLRGLKRPVLRALSVQGQRTMARTAWLWCV